MFLGYEKCIIEDNFVILKSTNIEIYNLNVFENKLNFSHEIKIDLKKAGEVVNIKYFKGYLFILCTIKVYVNVLHTNKKKEISFNYFSNDNRCQISLINYITNIIYNKSFKLKLNSKYFDKQKSKHYSLIIKKILLENKDNENLELIMFSSSKSLYIAVENIRNNKLINSCKINTYDHNILDLFVSNIYTNIISIIILVIV